MDISLQRKWKTLQVQEAFERIGNLDPSTFPHTLETVGTDEVYNYRSKITPHYDEPPVVVPKKVVSRKKKKSKRGGNGGNNNNDNNNGSIQIQAIGFKKKINHQVVDVPNCHIDLNSSYGYVVQHISPYHGGNEN